MGKLFGHIAFCILVTFYCNVRAASDTPHCEKDADAFKECLKSEHDKNLDDDKSKLYKIGKRVNQCFIDNDCGSLANVTGLQLIEGAWQELPKDVRQCFINAYRTLALNTTNTCLTQQKVDQIKELNNEDNDLDEFSNKTLPNVWFAKGLLRVAIALKDCRSEKGGKNANATVSCLATVKKDIVDAVCKRADKCRKDKVSDTCYQQNQKIHQALCACGQSKLKTIIKSIKDLESKGEDVQIQQIIDSFCTTCSDDQKTMAANVKKCFDDKKVNISEKAFDVVELVEGLTKYLTLAVHDPTGPAHAVLGLFLRIEGPTADKNELTEIRNVLTDILQNIDCGCTKSSSRLFY